MNHQTVDIYLWFAEFEIHHGFHPDQYPDQPCWSLPIRLHNKNTSYQQILNIFQIITRQDIQIMGSHLLTCQNKYQNWISVITTYADGMFKPNSNYIIQTKSEYASSLCLRHINNSGI